MGFTIDQRAGAAAAVTVVLWATAFVSIRATGEYLDPGPLALGRLLCAAVVLVVIWVITREGPPPRRAWPGIVVAGVLWFGVYMVALNWGEQLVDAGTAALVVNIGPILIALLGGWFLGEGFAPRLFLGIAVAFVGVAVVSLSTVGGADTSVLGVLLCLVAAITYAVGVVAQKPALRYASPLQFTTFSVLTATVLCSPFAPQLISQLESAPSSAWINTAYLGIFPTAIAFMTWAYALRHTAAGKLGASTYAVPALVVVISWLFLGETPGWLALIGGALCLLGVAISRAKGTGRRTRNPRDEAPAES